MLPNLSQQEIGEIGKRNVNNRGGKWSRIYVGLFSEFKICHSSQVINYFGHSALKGVQNMDTVI